MRLKHTLINELYQLMAEACIEIGNSKNILAKLQKIHCFDEEYHLTLEEY